MQHWSVAPECEGPQRGAFSAVQHCTAGVLWWQLNGQRQLSTCGELPNKPPPKKRAHVSSNAWVWLALRYLASSHSVYGQRVSSACSLRQKARRAACCSQMWSAMQTHLQTQPDWWEWWSGVCPAPVMSLRSAGCRSPRDVQYMWHEYTHLDSLTHQTHTFYEDGWMDHQNYTHVPFLCHSYEQHNSDCGICTHAQTAEALDLSAGKPTVEDRQDTMEIFTQW